MVNIFYEQIHVLSGAKLTEKPIKTKKFKQFKFFGVLV